MKKFILIAGFVLLAVIYVKYSPPPRAAIGVLPNFSLVIAQQGHTQSEQLAANMKAAGIDLKSEELKGKVLVVDFWASWCEPCKSEIPKYNKLVADMAGKDFQMIGYAVESGNLDEVRKSAKELGIQYQVVMGTDAVTEAFGNYRGLPTTFLVGKDGKIYKKYEGTSASKVDEVGKDIANLLAVPYTAPAVTESKPTAQLVR
jgi:thiol-disulfide isomerase/thioredoxin